MASNPDPVTLPGLDATSSKSTPPGTTQNQALTTTMMWWTLFLGEWSDSAVEPGGAQAQLWFQKILLGVDPAKFVAPISDGFHYLSSRQRKALGGFLGGVLGRTASFWIASQSAFRVHSDCGLVLGRFRGKSQEIPGDPNGGTPPAQEMVVTLLPATRFGLNRYGFQYFFKPDRSSMVSGSIY